MKNRHSQCQSHTALSLHSYSHPPNKLGSLDTHVYRHTNTHVYMLFRLRLEILWKTMIISVQRIYFIYAFCLYVSVLPWRKPGAHRRRDETVRMLVFSCIINFAYASVFLHQLPHAVATATGASALRLQMLTSTDIRKTAPNKPVRTLRGSPELSGLRDFTTIL